MTFRIVADSSANLVAADGAELASVPLSITAGSRTFVDSEALAQALNEGRLAGAGIDVFEGEPPIAPEHPLCHAKNTVLTPHVAFASAEALAARADIVFANIEKWLAGAPQNVIK